MCMPTNNKGNLLPRGDFFFFYLGEQEGERSKGEGPAVFIGEVGFTAFGPVQHLIIDAGYVEDQAHHQGQT